MLFSIVFGYNYAGLARCVAARSGTPQLLNTPLSTPRENPGSSLSIRPEINTQHSTQLNTRKLLEQFKVSLPSHPLSISSHKTFSPSQKISLAVRTLLLELFTLNCSTQTYSQGCKASLIHTSTSLMTIDMTDQDFLPVGFDWDQDLPTPTTPFTMTFPDGFSDNVPEGFRDLPGVTDTSFENLFDDDDDPMDFSDLVAIAKGESIPSPSVKPANSNQSIEQNEEYAAESNSKDGNATEDDISRMSLAGNHDDVSGASAQSSTPTNNTNEAFNAGGNTEFNPYAFGDDVHNNAVEHHKQAGFPESNSFQSNPDLSHTEAHISSSGPFNPNDWDSLNGPIGHVANYNNLYDQSVQYGPNSLLPHTSISKDSVSTADAEPINLTDWDAVNDTIQKTAATDHQDDQSVALSSGARLSDTETPNTAAHRSSMTPEIARSHNSSHYMHDVGNQAFGFVANQSMYSDQRGQHSMLVAQRAGLNLLSQGGQLRNSMSPGRMASDDDKTNSMDSPEFSSAVLPQSVYESRQPSSNLNTQYYRQGSPSLYLNCQQQQPRRPQSNLRHMSVPGQPAMTFYPTANTNARLLQQHIDGPSNSSSVTASPSMRRQQPNLISGDLAGSSYVHGGPSNEMVTDYLTKTYPAGQVIDLRGHSPASDARIQQHSLNNSPGSGRGFHTDMTPNLFQSPQPPIPMLDQNFCQNLAFQHLSSLPSNYAVQAGINSSMKKENSSPESASGALRKVKRDSRHVGSRRGSQVSGSQSSTVDSEDQQMINDMYDAMMDTDNTEDNPGMIKTWNGLRKETNKVRKVCEQLLVSNLVQATFSSYNH